MNLKELSQHLGLSPTTVSRALNGYPEVSERTRKRVQAAAREFNYSPSVKAKGLATGRALAIGHVIPTSKKSEMVNPIFSDFLAGAGEAYSTAGYDMILSVVPEAAESAAYRTMATQRKVECDGGIRSNEPLDRTMRDIAFMPQRHILERWDSVAADHPCLPGQVLCQDRVALVRHGARALLARRKVFLCLQHFGALQVAHFDRQALNRARDYG